MSRPRSLRSVHRGEGWAPAAVASHAMPALAPSFAPLAVSGQVFAWAPI